MFRCGNMGAVVAGVCFTLLIHLVASSSTNQPVFYEMTRDNMCTGVVTASLRADLLCTIDLPTDSCRNVTLARVHWFFASPTTRYAISLSNKYGIWEEPVESGVISSVLRIQSVGDSDMGIYTCALTCNTNDQVSSKKLELCVKDAATGLVVCSRSTSEDTCTHLFSNGLCDEHCDSEDQLFDGDDCNSFRDDVCPTTLQTECSVGYADTICDYNCSFPQCGFDGGDCLPEFHSITRETLGVVVPSSLTSEDLRQLSQELSVVFSTLVKVNGETESWSASDSGGVLITYLNADVFQQYGSELMILKYKLVPHSCVSDRPCFHRVVNAAKYLSHLLLDANSTVISQPVAAIGVDSGIDSCPIRKEIRSPNSRISIDDLNRSSEVVTTTESKSLGGGEIAGIVLCVVSIILLTVGILLALHYQKIVKARKQAEAKQRQSDVKSYIATLPAYDGPHTPGDITPQSESSICRSVTSKDTIIPRSSRTNIYRTEECHQV